MPELPQGNVVETEDPRVDFEEKKFNFGRGEVSFMHATPEQIKKDAGTGEPVIPLLFVHGHGQDPKLERNLKRFAQTGRDTFGVAYTDKRVSKDAKPREKEGVSVKVPPYQLEKADDMVEAMDASGIERADIVATSEGALRAMIAVAQHPEKFRNIVLVHPAGMDNRGFLETHARVVDNYGRLLLDGPVAHHYGRDLQEPRKGKDVQEKSPGGLKGFIKKGPLEILREQRTVAHSRFDSLIPELRAEHPHLHFSMIADKNDRVYPPKRLQKINGDNLDEFMVSDWGGHGMAKGGESIPVIDEMLTRMEQSSTV
jgi:pimeloyl-ACP methyl ester carboxylesterase